MKYGIRPVYSNLRNPQVLENQDRFAGYASVERVPLGVGNLLLTVAECLSQFNDMVNEREKPAAYTQYEGATHDVHENKGSEKFLLEQPTMFMKTKAVISIIPRCC